MDFGADFILEEVDADLSEPEDKEEAGEMSDDDFSGFECEVMDWSGDDDDDPPKESNATKTKKANLNNVGLTMSSLLEEPDQVVTGDPVICSNGLCKAAFSHINKIEEKDGKKIWRCKFCDRENEEGDTKLPDLEEGKSDVMYTTIENCKPCVNGSGESADANEGKDMEVIFVIDTSTSMCQPVKDLDIDSDPLLKEIVESQEVPNQLHLLMQVMQTMNPQLQLPTIKEATRLQAIKAAVITQIQKLKSEKPKAKVGLVTFCDKVTIHGDGSRELKEIDGNQIDKNQFLAQTGLNHTMRNTVDDTADTLVSKVKSLKEEGRTALGPALYIALHMVTEKGSRIILCTDGFANVGVGKLEDAREEDINMFYDDVMNYSKTHGISVSILACDEAGLNTKLGDVPDQTGGTIAFLDPKTPDLKKLGDIIDKEINRPILAVHGHIQFVVHKSMYVVSKTRSEDKEKSSKDSYYTHSIGNILKDKRIPFTFNFRDPCPGSQRAITDTDQPGSDDVSIGNQGTPQPSDQQGKSQNAVQQGSSQNADHHGTSQNADQQGTSQNADHHGTSQNADQQGTSQNSDQQGTSQNADQQGTSQPSDQQGTSQNSDQQGISQNADQQGTSQPSDQQGTSQPSDQQGTSQNSDQQGISQNADQQGTSQPSDQQGTSQNSDQQGSSVDQQGAIPNKNTTSSSDIEMDADSAEMETIPFQVQIKFTDMKDRTAQRIWTSERQKTKDREKVENSVTPAGIKNHVQTAAGDLLSAKEEVKVTAKRIVKQIEDVKNKAASGPGMQDELTKLDEFLELAKQLIHHPQGEGLSDKITAKLKEFQEGRSTSTKG